MSPGMLLLLFLVGWSDACNFLSKGLTEKEKVTLLSTHNEMRNYVALGHQRELPTASNMKEMVWDDSVASAAQAWADQCTFARGQVGFVDEYMGQNLAWTIGSKMDIKEQLNNFYHEVELINPHDVASFRSSDDVGHFTQVIWAESYRLGCGKTAYNNGNGREELLVCNYAPGGNFVGASIYEAGEPCSRCMNGCSSNFIGLCETERLAANYDIEEERETVEVP